MIKVTIRDLPPLARLPILLLGMFSLIAGVMAGLARLGWSVPDPANAAAGVHGALMISAFFGTVISLERAVAVARRWAYLAPALAAASGIALLGGWLPLAQTLAIGASIVMTVSCAVVLHRLIAPFTLVLTIATTCWLVGNLVWLHSGLIAPAAPWWLAFLVLTIAGERLELSRFIPTPPAARYAFYLIVAGIIGGATISLWHADGLRLYAGGLLALALWLLRFDIAWRNARLAALPRFIAICLLGGYVWLAFAGVLGFAGALENGHPWRDSALHALGIGFVFAMVFGHAPIIFPAVARVRIPYHPAFYIPLLLLHLSLLIRVAGSLGGSFSLLKHGALLNSLALLSFIISMLISVARGKKTRTAPP